MTKIKKKGLRELLLALSVLLILAMVFFLYIKPTPKESLDNFRAITLDDPLFVSPEFEEETFNSSLNYLQETQKKFLESFGFTEEVASTRFLEQLLLVDKAQDNFLNNPNKDNAEQLLESYIKATNVYREEVTNLKVRVMGAFPIESNQSLVYPGSTSSNQIIVEDLGLMLANAEALNQEIKRREDILEGWRRYISPNIKLEPVTLDNGYNVDSRIGLVGKDGLLANNDIYFIKTSCFQGVGEVVPFALLKLEKGGREFLVPKIVNDNYYQKFSNLDRVGKEYLDRGMEWHQIREGNTYRCNDLTYQVQLLTLKEFRDRYRGGGILKNLTNKDINLSEAQELEERVLGESGYYDFSDLELLGRYYQYFYQEDKTSQLTEELRERYLMIKNKQAGLDQILNTAFYFDNIEERLRLGAIGSLDGMKNYLVAARSSYPIVFLSSSDVVWRLEQRPKYLTDQGDQDVYSTHNVLLEKYSPEQVRAFGEISEYDLLRAY